MPHVAHAVRELIVPAPLERRALRIAHAEVTRARAVDESEQQAQGAASAGSSERREQRAQGAASAGSSKRRERMHTSRCMLLSAWSHLK